MAPLITFLPKTSEENISYEVALQQAQQLGYAESNPTMDTEGFDAKFKLLILIAHAFGVVAKPEDIFNLGINKLGDLELKLCERKRIQNKIGCVC
jgi:homoserine dehydrogenase